MRATDKQDMLALAVALQEVFLIAVAAQKVVARVETIQEVLMCAVPLKLRDSVSFPSIVNILIQLGFQGS